MELKVPVSVVFAMSSEEFDGWQNYFHFKEKEEKKRQKLAANRGRRGR